MQIDQCVEGAYAWHHFWDAVGRWLRRDSAAEIRILRGDKEHSPQVDVMLLMGLEVNRVVFCADLNRRPALDEVMQLCRVLAAEETKLGWGEEEGRDTTEHQAWANGIVRRVVDAATRTGRTTSELLTQMERLADTPVSESLPSERPL